jgi:hypothetical protein
MWATSGRFFFVTSMVLDGEVSHWVSEHCPDGMRLSNAWACPSGESRNVGAIDEHVEGGSIFLTLTARPGTQLDRSGIEECLAYMLHQAIKE